MMLNWCIQQEREASSFLTFPSGNCWQMVNGGKFTSRNYHFTSGFYGTDNTEVIGMCSRQERVLKAVVQDDTLRRGGRFTSLPARDILSCNRLRGGLQENRTLFTVFPEVSDQNEKDGVVGIVLAIERLGRPGTIYGQTNASDGISR